jgi:hypothetical protein
MGWMTSSQAALAADSNGNANANGNDSNGNDSNGNGDGNGNGDSCDGDSNDNGDSNSNSDECDDSGNNNDEEEASPPPPPAPRAAPPPPAAARPPQNQGPCYFQLGFLFLHQLLNGLDGDCTELEHPDPNGTGDQVQATSRTGVPGLMVWQKFTNTMRWTDGGTTVTFSKCGLQYRPALRTFGWERNPELLAGEGPPPLGACDLT